MRRTSPWTKGRGSGLQSLLTSVSLRLTFRRKWPSVHTEGCFRLANRASTEMPGLLVDLQAPAHRRNRPEPTHDVEGAVQAAAGTVALCISRLRVGQYGPRSRQLATQVARALRLHATSHSDSGVVASSLLRARYRRMYSR